MKRRKPKAQRKEHSIRVRVTEEQKRALADRAAREGLDVSAWLRALGLREAAKSRATNGAAAANHAGNESAAALSK